MASTFFYTTYFPSASSFSGRLSFFICGSVEQQVEFILRLNKGLADDLLRLERRSKSAMPFFRAEQTHCKRRSKSAVPFLQKTLTHYVIHTAAMHGCCLQAIAENLYKRVGIIFKNLKNEETNFHFIACGNGDYSVCLYQPFNNRKTS